MGKLEKHLLSSCHTELQRRFTGRPIQQVLMSPAALPSTSVWMSLLLCKQAASNLCTHLKNPSSLVSSYINMLTNMQSKFPCYIESICMSCLPSLILLCLQLQLHIGCLLGSQQLHDISVQVHNALV